MICKQLKLLFLMLTESCTFQWKSGAVKSKGNQNGKKFELYQHYCENNYHCKL
jgi:hypothetical protein